MRYSELASRKAVFQAIAECDRLGRDAFLDRHGFERATEYVLRYEGREYDSKAIFGVAYSYQYPSEKPLEAGKFSGGLTAAGGHLAKLGFEVDGIRLKPGDWSLDEVEAIVDDYFAMFRLDILGEPYNKAQHNRDLRERLNDRSKSSVELKHQNISAHLQNQGLRWLTGYLPRGNSQTLLRAVLNDYIEDHPDIFDVVQQDESINLRPDMIVDPPPAETVGNTTRARRAVKTDFAGREAQNRELGRAGEQWVLQFLRESLRKSGQTDLAAKVRWVSDELGDGLGYDIEAYGPDGQPLYVEVKTTNGPISAPFLISANEVRASSEIGDRYSIYRVFDFAGDPRVYILQGPVEITCHLVPQIFKAIPASAD